MYHTTTILIQAQDILLKESQVNCINYNTLLKARGSKN